ncbi:MAG: XRE family transcriptional regulator [Pirellulaceae bacterium]|jgi:Zn-dependent peptidase ImmA (M78 family)/transcriptional regulator with XRE-family HTH domain|nr:XRE family transcriptional regulator [Pirellulaceae bacterium]
MAKTTKRTTKRTLQIGTAIRSQRESMRMTVGQLAKRVGVSRNTITNYESGKTEPSASDLVRLSEALGCQVAELLGIGEITPPPRFAFRAHVPLRKDPSIIVSARKYLRAYAEIEEIMDSRLSGQLRRFVCNKDGPLSDRDIEAVADTLRQSCGLHDTGPENIASMLESLGVRTLFFEHDGKGLEGLSTIQGDMVLVLLRLRSRIVERTIFSAAHELGHLVLHPQLFSDNSEEVADEDSKRYEKEADSFAGNFLVPSDEVVRIWREERLDRLSLFNALLLLKRIFHVSFHCLYHRVTELDLTQPVDRPIFINQIKRQLGITGKATMEELEPDPLNPDILYRTTRFSRLIRSAFLQELIGVSKVAEMFQVTVDEANEITSGWLRPRYEMVDEECPV